MSTTERKRVTLQLDESDLDLLTELARKEDRDLSAVARRLIREEAARARTGK